APSPSSRARSGSTDREKPDNKPRGGQGGADPRHHGGARRRGEARRSSRRGAPGGLLLGGADGPLHLLLGGPAAARARGAPHGQDARVEGPGRAGVRPESPRLRPPGGPPDHDRRRLPEIHELARRAGSETGSVSVK